LIRYITVDLSFTARTILIVFVSILGASVIGLTIFLIFKMYELRKLQK